MNKNNNVKCIICGKGYHLCRSCKDKLAIAPYKLLTDTSEHYKVYQVINGYRGKVYTKAEAKEVLKNIDTSDKETYLDSVKKILSEICDTKEEIEIVTETTKSKRNIKSTTSSTISVSNKSKNSETQKSDKVKVEKTKINKLEVEPLVVEKEVDIVVVNDKIADTTNTEEEN